MAMIISTLCTKLAQWNFSDASLALQLMAELVETEYFIN